MSYSYFENRECEFYPCHGMENINCMFCYCPLYPFENCGGNPVYAECEDGSVIKDCSKCVFPHIKENYQKIIERLCRK